MGTYWAAFCNGYFLMSSLMGIKYMLQLKSSYIIFTLKQFIALSELKIKGPNNCCRQSSKCVYTQGIFNKMK